MFTLSRAEVRELDRRAAEEFGVPGVVLMENAGRGCAELLMRLNPDRKPVVILCGPGNNGGDGFVIARHLDNAGWPVQMWCFFEPGSVAGDAKVNFEIVSKLGLPIRFVPPPPAVGFGGEREGMSLDPRQLQDMWVVDALFGTGLARPIDAKVALATAFVRFSRAPVLAVDIPSGLDCDTGEPLGPNGLRATHTATFVAPKRGFLNPASKAWTGEVHVIDIGAPRALVDQYRRPANT